MNFSKHNKIKRSTSRVWKKSELNKVVKACKAGGYDVVNESKMIAVGIEADNMLVLKALKGNGGWLVRYDQKLFDENYEG